MSVINKKPYIQSVLDTLSEQNLKDLSVILNSSSNNALFRSFLNETYKFSTSDKGINKLVFEVKDKIYTGAFIYNDSVCVLITWKSDTDQKLGIININYVSKSYSIVEEKLSINELRRIVENKLLEIEQGYDTSKFAQVHNFEEATILTDDILAEVKSGDIVKVANMEFVVNNKVNQSPRSITGKMVGVISGTSITIAKLDWVKGEELEPELITMNAVDGVKVYLHELSFSMTSDSVADHTIKVLSKSSTEITLANITTTLADSNIISAQLNRSDKMLFSLVVSGSSVNLSVITQAVGALGFQTMDIAQATYLEDTVDDLIE